jgi:hypothetical protein
MGIDGITSNLLLVLIVLFTVPLLNPAIDTISPAKAFSSST